MRARANLLARIVMPGTLLVFSTAALAAGVAFRSSGLGAASANAARCATGGLSVLQNLSGSTVISVTVGNLPAACAGATIQAAIWNGTASGTGSTTVPAGGGSVTITLGAAPALTAGEQTDIVMSGP